MEKQKRKIKNSAIFVVNNFLLKALLELPSNHSFQGWLLTREHTREELNMSEQSSTEYYNEGLEHTKAGIKKLLWIAAVVVLVLAALIITNVILHRRISNLEAELELVKATTSGVQDSRSETQISEFKTQDETDQENPKESDVEMTEQAVSEPPTATEPPVQKTPPASTITPLVVIDIYAHALADCRAGWYSRAIAGFQKVLKYPLSHDLKDNAQYWLAECYYVQKVYDRALTEFQKVKEYFPKGNKVFDAELKIAYTYYSMKRMEHAKQKLSQVSKAWPQRNYNVQIDALADKIRLELS